MPKIVKLLEHEHLVRFLCELVVPLVHTRVGAKAHRLSDLVDPAVWTQHQVGWWDRRGVRDAEGVFVDWLDRAPGLGSASQLC